MRPCRHCRHAYKRHVLAHAGDFCTTCAARGRDCPAYNEQRSPFEYVREAYGVPAGRGVIVFYRGKRGRMVHADHHVLVRFEGEKRRVRLHPCEAGLTYAIDTPARFHPRTAVPYYVWSEVCHNQGIRSHSPEGYALLNAMRS